jgi:Tol biopolymer transport system component/DNA-binding winged helix-turn-helix (wHTH) protein
VDCDERVKSLACQELAAEVNYRVHLLLPDSGLYFMAPEVERQVATACPLPLCARFDQFHVDLTGGILQRSGVRVSVQSQPLQVLRLLLEAEGNVVTRDELRKVLWPEDTFVDFELGVNTAVKKLRQALADSAERPKFIETLPRIGYRFLVPVEWVTGSNGKISSPSAAQPNGHTDHRPNWLKIGAGLLFGTISLTAVYWAYLRWEPRNEQVLTPKPLTAFPGQEVAPSFSPDGTQIVFAWTGDPATGSKGFDLYLKVVGSEKVLRLTYQPSEWVTPAWSPDGTKIAFHRLAGAETGLYIIPALGGPERKLRSTNISDKWSFRQQASSISWSSDGMWIAYVDSAPSTLNLLSVESLESKRLPLTANCVQEGMPAFSHQGTQLAYLCSLDSRETGIYTVATGGGTPKQIARLPGGLHSGVTWTADDRRLILAQSQNGESELVEITIANGSLQKLPFGSDIAWPTISRDGDRLAFTSSSDNINIWRKDLLHPELVGVKVLASTHEQANPSYSPDGKHIAFESTRGGAPEIWVSESDGSNLAQITRLNHYATGTPRWSPEGRKIVFDSWHNGHPEIFVVDISELIPHKLSTNIPDIFQPNWSHDGKWIYFLSFGDEALRAYRCPANGGTATVLSSETALGLRESFDGETVYFVDRRFDARLKKVSVNQAGSASLVEGMPLLKDPGLWTVVPGGIYFVPAEAPHSICYFDLSTRHIRRITEVDRDFNSINGGMSVSPDGRWILYSQVDDVNSDIMLVDHFR